MKKRSLFAILLVVTIILTYGCSSSSSMDEGFSEPEDMTSISSLPAESLDESESVNSVSSLSTESLDESESVDDISLPPSVSFDQPPYPIPLPRDEPLYTTEDGNVWLVNVGYHDPENGNRNITVCVTLPEEYYVVNTIIYSLDRDTKVAGLYSFYLPDGETLAGMFEDENEADEFLVGIMDSGGYTQSDGREVSFQIIEYIFENHGFLYDYCMRLTDEIAIGIRHYADEYNPEEVKPLIEPIFASIQLYEA